MIQSTNRKVSAGRGEASRREPHRPSRAAAETLESRCLLSAYVLSQIGYFGTNDTGANPLCTLVADTAGDLFGTARVGGAYGVGTVFEVLAGSNKIVPLASFNSTDGAFPGAGVMLDSAGNLYGTTMEGGTGNFGTVFEIARGSNTIGTLASFTGASPSFGSGVALDADGNMYGTTRNGGANNGGTVFEVAKGSTTVTTLASFNITSGEEPTGGVTLDATGNLYGTTSVGGPDTSPGTLGGGTVFEIARGSGAVTTLATFNGANGAGPQATVTLDAAGNVYGTTEYGGASGDGTVFEVSKGSSTVTTLASLSGPFGLRPFPESVTLDSEGNLYGATQASGPANQGTVFEIARGSTTLTRLASFSGPDGEGPNGLMLDAAGNLYGATLGGGPIGSGTVFEIPKGSTAVATLASFSVTDGAYPDANVALDSAGNLYGTTSSGTVFEIAAASATVRTLVSVNSANGVTPDSAGDLYGTTYYGGPSGDGTVFEVAAGSGTVTTLASLNGKNGANPTGGVTMDSAGNLYGTTQGGGASNAGPVFEIAKGSSTIITLASFDGTNGTDPIGPVTLDAAGNLYGAAAGGGAGGHGTVFEIANGSTTITTLAASYFVDNGNPEGGVTLDGAGNLYGTTFSASGNGAGTVFEIGKGTSTVTTLASFSGRYGDRPQGGVTVDAGGNVYGTTEGGDPHLHIGSNYGTVFEIARGSFTVTTLATFNIANGATPLGTLALNSAGDLYGATYVGGASGLGTVFKLSPAIPGDANLDGKVDFADLVLLARNYGKTSAAWSDGDFNGDGTVGFDDLVVLAGNYDRALPTFSADAAASLSGATHSRFLSALRRRSR